MHAPDEDAPVMPTRFRRIESRVEIGPLLAEIDAHPEIWEVDARRQREVAVQRETETVPILLHPEPQSFREARRQHPLAYRGRPTEIATHLPRTRAFVDDLTRRLHGRVGRAALVRLRPQGRVYEHVDRGLYYHLRDRYHLVLRSPLGSRLRAESEEVRMAEGELWWFDNRLPHEAFNDAGEPRIHLIVDVLGPGSLCRFLARLLSRPGVTAEAFVRRLRKAVLGASPPSDAA